MQRKGQVEAVKLIVLLSGDGKYSLEGEDLDSVLELGRDLFLLLKSQRYEEFSRILESLHTFVKTHGTQVEVLKSADIVVPPLNCSPAVLDSIMGFHRAP